MKKFVMIMFALLLVSQASALEIGLDKQDILIYNQGDVTGNFTVINVNDFDVNVSLLSVRGLQGRTEFNNKQFFLGVNDSQFVKFNVSVSEGVSLSGNIIVKFETNEGEVTENVYVGVTSSFNLVNKSRPENDSVKVNASNNANETTNDETDSISGGENTGSIDESKVYDYPNDKGKTNWVIGILSVLLLFVIIGIVYMMFSKRFNK